MGTLYRPSAAFVTPFFRALSSLFPSESYLAIVNVGENFPFEEWESSLASSNVIFVKFISQVRLMKHVDLFITHAGLNGYHDF
jgi:hypothetical protein